MILSKKGSQSLLRQFTTDWRWLQWWAGIGLSWQLLSLFFWYLTVKTSQNSLSHCPTFYLLDCTYSSRFFYNFMNSSKKVSNFIKIPKKLWYFLFIILVLFIHKFYIILVLFIIVLVLFNNTQTLECTQNLGQIIWKLVSYLLKYS